MALEPFTYLSLELFPQWQSATPGMRGLGVRQQHACRLRHGHECTASASCFVHLFAPLPRLGLITYCSQNVWQGLPFPNEFARVP